MTTSVFSPADCCPRTTVTDLTIRIRATRHKATFEQRRIYLEPISSPKLPNYQLKRTRYRNNRLTSDRLANLMYMIQMTPAAVTRSSNSF